jgi:pimeloyl-ACP methyl ester carboxylesterase
MPEITISVSTRLYYRKMGSGPVAILLHGFPESSSLWRKVWDELAASFTLIIPDFPGSGNSSLDKETSIAQMAECVKAIMDEEHIDKAVIAGHSMGGYVGFAFAEKYPNKVCGLSLVHSTPQADDEEKKETRRKSIDLIKKGAKKMFITQMVPNLFSDAFKHSYPKDIEEQIALALEIEDKSLIAYYNAMIERKDHVNMLQSVLFPVQWVIGINDNIIYYKKILEFCYKSGINFVSFYSNCGHMSMLEAPEKLAPDLKAFINYSYEYQPMNNV